MFPACGGTPSVFAERCLWKQLWCWSQEIKTEVYFSCSSGRVWGQFGFCLVTCKGDESWVPGLRMKGIFQGRSFSARGAAFQGLFSFQQLRPINVCRKSRPRRRSVQEASSSKSPTQKWYFPSLSPSLHLSRAEELELIAAATWSVFWTGAGLQGDSGGSLWGYLPAL